MKLVIVTGGSKGLGKAIVEEYSAREHWHVVELSRSGTSKHSIQCDLSDTRTVEKLSVELFPELAREDWDEVVFISNAADLKPISLTGQITASDIERNISINQISAFTLISAFIANFRGFDGPKTIVSISSGAALKGYAGWSLYCASKAACENFINAIAVEEETQEFPFVAVNYDPNVMDTAMQAEIRGSDEVHFPAIERFIDYKESGKLRTAESVASDLIQKISEGMVSKTRYSVC